MKGKRRTVREADSSSQVFEPRNSFRCWVFQPLLFFLSHQPPSYRAHALSSLLSCHFPQEISEELPSSMVHVTQGVAHLWMWSPSSLSFICQTACWKWEQPIWRAYHYLTAIQSATGAHGIEFMVFFNGTTTGFSQLRVLKFYAILSRHFGYVIVIWCAKFLLLSNVPLLLPIHQAQCCNKRILQCARRSEVLGLKWQHNPGETEVNFSGPAM